MKRFSFFLLILLLVSCTLTIPITPEPTPKAPIEIHFIDVGQGDSVLILGNDGKNVLYDGGRKSATAEDYLEALGITKLDLVIASHADADHIAGLIEVVKSYQPAFFMDNGLIHTTQTYENLLLAVEAAGSTVLEPTQRIINLGEAKLKVIPPPGIASWDNNDNSIGILLDYGDFELALTGDAEPREFGWWLEHYPDLLVPVEVYKSPHHGSPNGDNQLSVTTFAPETVVIGVGLNNSYGHPSPEVLALYDGIGAKVFRTDFNGTVKVVAKADGSYKVFPEMEP